MKDFKDIYTIGTAVDVTALPGDGFHNFTGRVKGYHGEFVTVEDQDGDCWDCEPEQLEFNTDEIVHGNS